MVLPRKAHIQFAGLAHTVTDPFDQLCPCRQLKAFRVKPSDFYGQEEFYVLLARTKNSVRVAILERRIYGWVRKGRTEVRRG